MYYYVEMIIFRPHIPRVHAHTIICGRKQILLVSYPNLSPNPGEWTIFIINIRKEICRLLAFIIVAERRVDLKE